MKRQKKNTLKECWDWPNIDIKNRRWIDHVKPKYLRSCNFAILSEVREQPTRLFPAEFKYHLLGRTVLTKVRKVILTEAMWANDKLLAPKKMKILENCIAIFLQENESNEAY